MVNESIVTHELFCELTKMWHSKLAATIISAIAGKMLRAAAQKGQRHFPTRAVEGRKLLIRVASRIVNRSTARTCS